MNKAHQNELPIPPSSHLSEKAAEVLRVWINSDGNMDVTVMPSFPDPSMWGLLLVDIARHVSRAYEADGKFEQAAALQRIRQGLDVEWDHPTDLGRTNPLREQ